VAERRPWAFIDLFSGCGGLSAGLLATGGFEHLYAADSDQSANATYAKNLGYRPETVDLVGLADPKQRRIWAETLREQAAGRRLLLAGGPPCQGFSSHVKVRGDRHKRNELFAVFGSLALELLPDLILIENVADLVATRSWDLFCSLRSRLQDGGYSVRARIVNMAQLGVPQERFRTVVLASRDMALHFPAVQRRPSEFSTVKEWIGDLPPIESGHRNPVDPMHETSRHRQSTLEILRHVPPDGGSRPPGIGPLCLDRTRGAHGGYTDVYGRLAWSSPAPTITARCRTPSCGRFAHPEQHRGLTAREAGLLQTFPKDWTFMGPFDDRYKQIGNAVPPLAARAIGRHILAGLPPVPEEIGLFEVGAEPVGSSFSVLIPGIRRRGGSFR
jgi:DNA (cytosine-5)-methyltransferase 1